jgi:hypothetical protein
MHVLFCLVDGRNRPMIGGVDLRDGFSKGRIIAQLARAIRPGFEVEENVEDTSGFDPDANWYLTPYNEERGSQGEAIGLIDQVKDGDVAWALELGESKLSNVLVLEVYVLQVDEGE